MQMRERIAGKEMNSKKTYRHSLVSYCLNSTLIQTFVGRTVVFCLITEGLLILSSLVRNMLLTYNYKGNLVEFTIIFNFLIVTDESSAIKNTIVQI